MNEIIRLKYTKAKTNQKKTWKWEGYKWAVIFILKIVAEISQKNQKSQKSHDSPSSTIATCGSAFVLTLTTCVASSISGIGILRSTALIIKNLLLLSTSIHTVPCKKIHFLSIFPYKIAIFKRVWQTLKVMQHPW